MGVTDRRKAGEKLYSSWFLDSDLGVRFPMAPRGEGDEAEGGYVAQAEQVPSPGARGPYSPLDAPAPCSYPLGAFPSPRAKPCDGEAPACPRERTPLGQRTYKPC